MGIAKITYLFCGVCALKLRALGLLRIKRKVSCKFCQRWGHDQASVGER